MPRQPDHTYVMAEILAAELRADADLPRQLQHLRSSLRSRKAWPELAPLVGQRIELARVEASFTVLSVTSGEVPPMTIAR